MSMNRNRACLLLLGLLVGLAGCSRPVALKLPGYLYMGVGSEIIRLNLDTHHQRRVFTLPAPLKVDVLSKLSNHDLLVSTYPIHTIGKLNLKTGVWERLRSGWKAIAFPKLGVFVFYDAPKPGYYAQELYWASLSQPGVRHRIDPGPFPIQIPVVPTGSDRFVYTSWRKKHIQRLWSYNLTQARFRALPFTGAYPELDLGHQTLLCTQVGVSAHPYFLFRMRSRTPSVEPLRLESWYTPVRYLQASQSLLVGRAASSLFVSSSHRWTLSAYHLHSGQDTPILRRTQAGLDSVVWMKHAP